MSFGLFSSITSSSVSSIPSCRPRLYHFVVRTSTRSFNCGFMGEVETPGEVVRLGELEQCNLTCNYILMLRIQVIPYVTKQHKP